MLPDGIVSLLFRGHKFYFIAENMDTRSQEFQNRIMCMTGVSKKHAALELETSVCRIFTFAGLADKHEGLFIQPPMRGLPVALE